MKIRIERESLLRPLSAVAGVVERKQAMAILGNVLVDATGSELHLTASDLEVELSVACAGLIDQPGSITIPARKWFDIVRALPEGVEITMSVGGSGRLELRGGRSRFGLAYLPAEEFPLSEPAELGTEFSVGRQELLELLDSTSFAMAVLDTRYYLNGLLLEIGEGWVRGVATDGHRLAVAQWAYSDGEAGRRSVIVPRKGILELQRLAGQSDQATVDLAFGRNHLRARVGAAQLTSKLIDGKYPDYESVIPAGYDKKVLVDRLWLRDALQRVAILSNEKFRGVRLEQKEDALLVSAHNPEQESASEEVPCTVVGTGGVVGFNVSYVLDALNGLKTEVVEIGLRDSGSSVVFREPDSERVKHVVMPLKL